jgi:tritrans,polycis-undecaprenyl-diphosphate synthase [geranylgeranyl-diphosphate specific]
MSNDPTAPRPRRGLGETLAQAAGDAMEQRLLSQIRGGPIPRHLAIIMDGNRRFARGHGLLRVEGHLRGKEKLEELLNWCLEVGLRTLTVYALSTENLMRDTEEVRELMELFTESFRKIGDDPRVHRHRIRVRAIGSRERLPGPVQEAIRYAEERTRDYDGYFYNVAIAYGGREDILQAIRAIAREVEQGQVKPEAIDEAMVSNHLYTQDLPDPDLIFRTSGEERISNFLLWQSAYAELYFCDVLWPGLRKLDFLRAIHDYQRRQRRFGA